MSLIDYEQLQIENQAMRDKAEAHALAAHAIQQKTSTAINVRWRFLQHMHAAPAVSEMFQIALSAAVNWSAQLRCSTVYAAPASGAESMAAELATTARLLRSGTSWVP